MTTENSLIIKVDSTDTARAAKSLDELAAAGGKAEQSTVSLTKATDVLASIAKKAAAAFGLYKMAQYAQEATNLAARYETLGVALMQVGKNAGYSADQMNAFAAGIQKSGISMIESRATLTQMAQAHINLADATKLSRVAQDAAVIGGIN